MFWLFFSGMRWNEPLCSAWEPLAPEKLRCWTNTSTRSPCTTKRTVLALHCKFFTDQCVLFMSFDTICSIYLAEPTNNAVNRAVERLLRQGYPAHKMLVVKAQHAFHSTPAPPGVRSVRIQDFRTDDAVQLIIGTVQVLSRIPLHRVRSECVMLKPPAAVVVSCTSIYIYLYPCLNSAPCILV